jgi:hypothetical protein
LNLDGAKKCTECGELFSHGRDAARLEAHDGFFEEANGGSAPRSRAGSVLLVVAAIGVVALLGMFFSAGSGQGGSGGSSGAGARGGQSPKDAGSVTTTTPTPEQAERVRGIGNSVVASDFPELVGVDPWVSAYAYRGTGYLSALYTTATPSAGSADGAREVVVRVNEGTGEVNVIVSFR